MSLPLPPPTSAANTFIDMMDRINALSNNKSIGKYNKVKANWANTTIPAEAYSKLAYANAVAPQVLMKLLGNTGALGSMTEEQKRNALQAVQNAGFKTNNGLNLLSQGQNQELPSGTGQPATNSFSGRIKNAFHSLLNQAAPQQGQMQTQAMNAFNNPMPQQMPTQQPPIAQQAGKPKNGVTLEGEQWYDKDGNPVYEEDEKKPGMQLELTGGQRPDIPQDTYAQNEARYKGIVKEGEQSGDIRAKNIEDLNTTAFNAQTNQETLDSISDILASPEFEQIRNVPLAGHYELAYYEKEGSPEQQDMIGRYKTLTGNIIKNASRDFAGQFRKGEQTLLQDMKPNTSDTVDSAKGKTEALSVLNKMLDARSRETSKLMSEYHINKLQASEMADKKINGKEIRADVHDRLYPTVTVKNKKTGQIMKLTVTKAREMGIPNV